MDRLYCVVPCYNEEEVIHETAQRLLQKLESLMAAGQIAADSRILFVNDGSKDKTWPLIEALHQTNPIFSGVNLSRNRGHQNALLAGLMTVRDRCDVCISMDADLQDDIDAVDAMLAEYKAGSDIVYGVRTERAADTAFKRVTAHGFYSFMKAMGVNIVYNHADYRLMSRRALDALAEYREVHLFLRGMIPLVGFRTSVVPYARRERFAGVSKYPLKRMLALALDGITSFSVRPIRLIAVLGAFIFLISLVMVVVFLFKNASGDTVPGWTTLACSIWALGGVQIMCLGLIGEYIGKIYQETKRRPRYIIESVLDDREGLQDG